MHSEDRSRIEADEPTLAGDGSTGTAQRGSREARPPAPGQQLGRYVVIAALGSGGMGVVLTAYDPELDRKVALKLLRAEGDARAPASTSRLLREAQALARVSHPNVVAVFDVGTLGERVFLAMEFVSGQTLGRWAAAAPRSWREKRRALLDAAKGLAAVHAAGLVHRDVKPDNVMIDDAGRVRLMDLGLARSNASTPADPDAASASSIEASACGDLTRTGAMLGTPAYMAPEQFLGEACDARSDQFGFCSTAWEVLYGQRAFQAEGIPALALTVTKGALTEPPAATDVPRWLGRILERGLAREPDRRWPSMEALIEAMQTDPSRRWRRIGAAAFVVAGLAGAAVVPSARERLREQSCHSEATAMVGAWDPARRAEIRHAMLATGVPYAETTAARVDGFIDGYADSLAAAVREACLAREAGGADAALRWERAEACLEDRRASLDAQLDVLAQADVVIVREAAVAVSHLPRVERCLDPTALASQTLPPVEIRAHVRELMGRLAGVQAEHAAGRYDRATTRITALRHDAEALGWPPLVARARLWTGIVAKSAGSPAVAEQELEGAFLDALRSDDPEVAARAALNLADAVATARADYDGAARWGRSAEALLDRLGLHDGPMRSDLLASMARISSERGDLEGALAQQRRALELLDAALGPDHPRAAKFMDALAGILELLGRYEESLGLHQRALGLRESALGPDHPDVAASYNNLGTFQLRVNAAADALASHQRALAIKERSLGPDHPDIATAWANIGADYLALGRHDEALRWLEPGLAGSRAHLPPEHPDLATLYSNVGAALQGLGRLEEARERFEHALAIWQGVHGPDHHLVADALNNVAAVTQLLDAPAEALVAHERAFAIRTRAFGPRHPSVAMSHVNIASTQRALGRSEDALAHAEQALAIWQDALGPENPYLAVALLEHAENELALGRARAAIEHGTRAVRICESTDAPPEWLAASRFVLARASWAGGVQHEGARALAEAAREDYERVGPAAAKELEKVRAWLDRHAEAVSPSLGSKAPAE